MQLVKTLECAAKNNDRYLVDVYATAPASPDGKPMAYLRYPTFGRLKIISGSMFRIPESGEIITYVGAKQEVLLRDM